MVVEYTFVPVSGMMPNDADPLARVLGAALGNLGYRGDVEPHYDGRDILRGLRATPDRSITEQHLQDIRAQGFKRLEGGDIPDHTKDSDYQDSFVA